jgi:hypothetical protein
MAVYGRDSVAVSRMAAISTTESRCPAATTAALVGVAGLATGAINTVVGSERTFPVFA